MIKPKKLIEVAMPIKEISAESVRDKSIRHGHISTLHLWWARRPLPVCRAVVFASLVPDPLDENCPTAFSKAVEFLLGAKAPIKREGQNAVVNVYKPYEDIPHTAVVDEMEDNLRNRLMMFIGKFSDKYVKNEKQGKKTAAKNQLSDYSLIKWDNKNDEHILNTARKLIFVAHNAENGANAKDLLEEFDRLYQKIKKAEKELYETPDRHIERPIVQGKEQDLQNVINAFLAKMPRVFDPFAGGGAIPLEASRLGCNSYGNDINPVAHIVQRGSLEFPQKFGKPITFSKKEFINTYSQKEFEEQRRQGNVFNETVEISNRLSFDVKYFANKLIELTESEVGHFYPQDENGNKPIAYYWARTAICSNPSCGAEVPTLKQFYLSRKPDKKIYLAPIINGIDIQFKIKNGVCDESPWMNRGNLTCPCCGNVTDVKTVKKQFINKVASQRLLAVIWDGDNGKRYALPSEKDFNAPNNINYDLSKRPQEPMPVKYTQAMPSCTWGLSKWGDMFSDRQISTILSLVNSFSKIKNLLEFNSNNNYQNAILTYLAIFIDRISIANTSYGRWDVSRESLQHPYARQAISMMLDFPESNPFCTSTGSASNQIDWIVRYLEGESISFNSATCNHASSGEKNQFDEKSLAAVITDPPYYDAIAYADISDFFYVWLKRTLGDVFPLNFAFPLTPKSNECTALKHHHEGDYNVAKKHFEDKLRDIFSAIEFQTKGVVSIMFAHQSTEAWTTLCNSVLDSNMNISGSWAIDTELANRTVGLSGDALGSSVTVSCITSQKTGFGDYKEVQKEILKVIKKEVIELYALGFRGADLLTACFGKAVSVFGRYKTVEKSDGSQVTVAELLEMAKEAAFKAIISDIETDDITKFYIGWLNLFGFSEAAHDDVRRITQIGLNLDIDDIYKQHILIKTKDKGKLGTMEERIQADARLGTRPVNNATIDIAHRMMFLWKQANRGELLKYIADKAPNTESSVWRVLNSLKELLPVSKDQEYVTEILSNQDNLIKESKNRTASMGNQITLDLNN
jgi:putative DNA methylase